VINKRYYLDPSAQRMSRFFAEFNASLDPDQPF
jgi:hypothetical protein